MAAAINNVIIVGGGTAGWLAASHLAKKLKPVQSGINVSLVESKNIPPIGVGEGTVPAMRQTLAYFGIDETEFLVKCDATFKQSIKFVDWLDNPGTNYRNYYHHLFDFPSIQQNDALAHWLLGEAGDKSFADALSIQGPICDANLGPKLPQQGPFEGVTNYAYHLNAHAFSEILKDNAINKLGVNYLQAEVTDVKLAASGDIESIVTDELGEITADVFVDCTGFSSMLLGKALNVPFVSKRDQLFVDTALAVQQDYADPEQEIPSYTISTARKAGWIWDIGLYSRRGVGYVYSSNHTDQQTAEDDFRAYLGECGKDAHLRKIDMKIGHREVFWHKNCVAIGLSQGFVEPLEATGLLVFDLTSRLLAETFPASTDEIAAVAKRYNQKVQFAWERVIDFVKLHYCISRRDDTQFWLDNRNPETMSETLRENLEYWRHQLPSQYDFANNLSIFNLDNYLYVLYGMEFSTRVENKQNRLAPAALAKGEFQRIETIQQQALQQLLSHRELVKRLRTQGR